jgi:predicted alpha/beta hydrolase family esterase
MLLSQGAPLRVVIAPGNGCDDEIDRCIWYGWLKRQLGKRGISCTTSAFPDPLAAREEYWVPFLKGTLACDENTVVVGHSSGAAATLRLLETTKLAGAVLVSAYHSDLGDPVERASGYFARPWDWAAIRRNATRFLLQLHGLDDPLVPVEQGRAVSGWLKSEYHEAPSAGHYQRTVQPEMLRLILEKLDGAGRRI